MKKTKLDIYLAAITCAKTLLDDTAGSAVETKKIHDAFTANSGDERDWDYFRITVQQQRNVMKELRKILADSTRLDAAKAKAEAAKEAPAAQ